MTTLEEITKDVDNLHKQKIDDVAAYYWRLKEAHKAAKQRATDIYNQLKRVEQGIFPGKLSDSGVDKVQIPEMSRSFFILNKYNSSVVDKEKAFKWLADNGAESLIQETINSSTLTSYLKDLILEEGMDPPADIFKFSQYTTIGSAKYNPK